MGHLPGEEPCRVLQAQYVGRMPCLELPRGTRLAARPEEPRPVRHVVVDAGLRHHHPEPDAVMVDVTPGEDPLLVAGDDEQHRVQLRHLGVQPDHVLDRRVMPGREHDDAERARLDRRRHPVLVLVAVGTEVVGEQPFEEPGVPGAARVDALMEGQPVDGDVHVASSSSRSWSAIASAINRSMCSSATSMTPSAV